MTCHACRRPIDTGRSWLCVERGARRTDGTTVPADRGYCSPACLATEHGADT